MTLGSTLISLALLLIVAVVLARPFVRQRGRPARSTRRRVLLDEKEGLLAAIRQLEFDHDMGLIPDEGFAHERQELVQQAADLLRQLDELGMGPEAGPEPALAVPSRPTVSDGDLDAAIEAAISARRRSPAPVGAPVPPARDGAASVAAPARTPANEAAPDRAAVTITRPARFCPQCGSPVTPGDNFCAACGQRLTPKP